MATSKGLVAGDLQFTDAHGNFVDCAQSEQVGTINTDSNLKTTFLKWSTVVSV